MKLVLVSGARPNYMKIAPIVWEIRKQNRQASRGIQFVLVHTGQHYDRQLFEVFFQELDLPDPDYNLAVGAGSHAVQTGEVMLRFEPVLEKERPDLVVVVGDVNSTLACALTAVKMGIPVGHVEAGLRSFDRSMPEELNRLVTDQVSDYLFTTEPIGRENLLREGIAEEKIFFVGNVMVDTLMRHRDYARSLNVKEKLGLSYRSFGLLTLHRPSNVDDPNKLAEILLAVDKLAREIPIIFPCHPRTRKQMGKTGCAHVMGENAQDKESPNGRLLVVDPLGYLDFLSLMSDARLVLTDSGGIQEETTVLGVPCLTLRQNTERPITITQGTNVLVGNSPDRIFSSACEMMQHGITERRLPDLWDGEAAQRIVATLYERLPAYGFRRHL